ncbi:uncharacterized protein EDB91DRAFT_1121628 [Suillus paluster]|uniref:uncharacterized protein n=1 Tax=Suillus paluster TaxID=48578 RepID=UPI001B876A12|nr:uncharacterized protein EDB91DRAFT_1121628 [Suillus paluster]KAG1744918.1 hypothetical protein EDB91DRAFT_1121628 [Suillus paluster]
MGSVISAIAYCTGVVALAIIGVIMAIVCTIAIIIGSIVDIILGILCCRCFWRTRITIYSSRSYA